MGGLGNQLFQIFATISYAITNEQPFCFLYEELLGNRVTYWSNFLQYLKKFTVLNLPEMQIIHERGFNYNEIPYNSDLRDIKIYGYFQSYKYFENKYNSICKLIKLEEQKSEIKNKYVYDYDKLISMHFRLGDYKNLQHFHPVMNYEYYNNCIKHIINETNNSELTILYFCEKEDEHIVEETINKLRDNYTSSKFIKIDFNIDDWEQVLIMSLCKHNIIANSSFSWFGAYFNSREDKIVCYPDVWFGYAFSHNTIDLCPTTWYKISSN
jgi:hypothetical protein